MSDSNMTGYRDIVVGTAGHIDHGKTALIRALTGMDTDRLAEEKRRGISIDLGFAHLLLPGGVRIGFVDVPGHERFIRNMLAGAGGIEAVLLVVAANEGVKPQTREHFEICRLLGIERGIVVLSKADLATPEQLAAARSAIDELTAGSFLADAPVIVTSAHSRDGLEALRGALGELARETVQRREGGFARLPVDRSFSLKGFGTVVTGTLTSGTLHVGSTVVFEPGGRKARVRGLQVHGESVEVAHAGQRTAVNVSGVEYREIGRGNVLVFPPGLTPTRVLDGKAEWLKEAGEIATSEELLLHLGTAEIPAQVKRLDGFVRIELREPVLAAPGDRFILRRPSPSETIGGGRVFDAFPPRRLSRMRAAARLERLAAAPGLAARIALLADEKENGRTLLDLQRESGWLVCEIEDAARQSGELLLVAPAQRVVSTQWLARKRAELVRTLEAFHRAHPQLAVVPLAVARGRMDAALAQTIWSGFAAVRVAADGIALASHRPQVNARDEAALRELENNFRAAGYQPPAPSALSRGLLERLVKSGRLVRVSPELIFHADVIAHIRTSLASHKGRRFSVPEFKEWMQISRKYAIPLLEYLDGQRVTKRDGDNRVVL